MKYEDIIARPKVTVKQLCDSLAIDEIHVNKAVTAMKHDSQTDSVVSRDKLAVSKYISTADMIRIEAMLSKFNLPLKDKDFRISLI